MRLTTRQHALLRQAARARFGAGSKVWLFGSRTDDRRRGGDFDLLVQTEMADPASLVEARLAFLADLHATPEFEGEKIDVLLLAPATGEQRLPIHDVALATGVEL